MSFFPPDFLDDFDEELSTVEIRPDGWDQAGYRDGGVWVPANPILANESTSRAGGLFFSGYPVESRFIGSATLNLVISGDHRQLPATLAVYVEPVFAPDLWSDAHLPPLLPTTDYLVAHLTIHDFSNADHELVIDSSLLDAARSSQGHKPGFPLWTGAFALHLNARTANGTDLAISVTGTNLPIELDTRVFSGIEVDTPAYYGARSRPDICPVTGDELLREDMAWCAYHRQYEAADICDPDDIPPQPVRSNPRLVNER